MKSKRQEKILELIHEYEIETQEDLIYRLSQSGYEATQATISRDIRELKLTKIIDANGVYKYIMPEKKEKGGLKFNNVLVDSITKVNCSANIVVLRTFPGLANAVATGIDALNEESILGCVAGDDTIIIVLVSDAAAREICDRMKHLMRDI